MRRVATALLCLCAVTGCRSRENDRRVVQRWLACEECREGERDSVVALGERAVPLLAEALTGPPQVGRDNIRRQAERNHARLPSPLVAPQVYVQHYVDNYVATYQLRAADALRVIGTPSAHRFLLGALQNDSILYRADVLGVIGSAARISLTPIDGRHQHAPADSFVLVNPTVVVQDTSAPLPPRALSNVRVAFRVEVGGGTVTDSIQLTDTAGKAAVRWRLGPGVDSANVLRVVAAGSVVRFRATGRGFDRRLVFLSQPESVTVNQPVLPVVRLAVLDAWGRVDTAYHGGVVLNQVGTGFSVTDTLVGGEVAFPGLRLGVSGVGQRLLARLIGVPLAMSDPFNVVP